MDEDYQSMRKLSKSKTFDHLTYILTVKYEEWHTKCP
jgi:hypothetical protein